MGLRKMLLLVSMGLAVVGLAAPVAKADPLWLDPGTGEPLEGSQWFNASAGITMEIAGGAFQTGPATVHFSGRVFNWFLGNYGEITKAEITGPIATNLPGCQATSGATTASSESPWPITVMTPDEASLSYLTLIFYYSEGCAKFGVPATVRATSMVTVTTTWENVNRTEIFGDHEVCLTMNKSGDLQNEGTGLSVTLTTSGTGICIPEVALG